MEAKLLGIWKTDPMDKKTQEIYGDTTLEIKDNGELIYNIYSGTTRQEIRLTYRVKGKYLITNQPSHPHEETTEFFLQDNYLELFFDGVKSRYIRID
jgi:hypothetical protein